MIPLRSLLSALVLAAAVVGCTSDEATLSGFERLPNPVVNEVALPAVTDGASPFRFEAAGGSLLVVYFGYTNCPDVCPTTLSDLRVALDSLAAEDRERIGTAMVTIDPDRDTDDVIEGYVRSFLPEAAAVRTEVDSDLRAVASAFGADYGVTTAEDGTIEVIHTGSLYAVNSNGELLLSWPFGVPASDIAKDLEILLERERA